MGKIPGLRIRGDMCSLFFVGPGSCPDVQRSAMKLLCIKGVKEVMVTSGKYAFMVKSTDAERESVRQNIAKMHGHAVSIQCHYSYTK